MNQYSNYLIYDPKENGFLIYYGDNSSSGGALIYTFTRDIKLLSDKKHTIMLAAGVFEVGNICITDLYEYNKFIITHALSLKYIHMESKLVPCTYANNQVTDIDFSKAEDIQPVMVSLK